MTTPIPPTMLEAATKAALIAAGWFPEGADREARRNSNLWKETKLETEAALAAAGIAKLQAAADALPVLVAALENLLAHCEMYFNIGEVGGKEAGIVEAARAAIAKAKGGAQ